MQAMPVDRRGLSALVTLDRVAGHADRRAGHCPVKIGQSRPGGLPVRLLDRELKLGSLTCSATSCPEQLLSAARSGVNLSRSRPAASEVTRGGDDASEMHREDRAARLRRRHANIVVETDHEELAPKAESNEAGETELHERSPSSLSNSAACPGTDAAWLARGGGCETKIDLPVARKPRLEVSVVSRSASPRHSEIIQVRASPASKPAPSKADESLDAAHGPVDRAGVLGRVSGPGRGRPHAMRHQRVVPGTGGAARRPTGAAHRRTGARAKPVPGGDRAGRRWPRAADASQCRQVEAVRRVRHNAQHGPARRLHGQSVSRARLRRPSGQARSAGRTRISTASATASRSRREDPSRAPAPPGRARAGGTALRPAGGPR
jgi:hypothetical protein